MTRFRTLIIWLLLLAIPLQGYASVTMMLCKSGAPSAMTAQTPAHTHAADDGGHQHDSMAAPAAAHHHDDADMPAAGHHDMSTPPLGDEPSEHCVSDNDTVKCSTCASCCVAAAIAPSFTLFSAVKPLGSERIGYAAVHFTAHIPSGLDRPPHSPIA